MEFFVIQIASDGIPGKLQLADGFNDAVEICAKIARKHKVPEETIQKLIFEEDNPGVFFTTDNVAGVWVIAAE